MNTTWTPEQLNQLKTLRKEGKTNAQVAKIMHRSEGAVRSRYSALMVDARTKFESDRAPQLNESLPPCTIAPEDDKSRVAYWRKRAGELEKKLSETEVSKTATDILVEEARALAPQAYSPAPDSRKFLDKGVSSEQSAVLMVSDCHVGAVVRPSQTLGFGEYNFPTFLRRLKRLEDSVASILADHTTTPISELVVPIIGDVLDGALTHGAEAAQINTMFSQFYGASHALGQFIRNLSTLVPKVRVYTCVGNHPRMPNQHKVPTKNRFSNLDHFAYAYLEALLRDIPKVEFTLNSQPMAEFQVQGFNFLAAHGDCLRGGDKALGIPSHAIGRAVSATTQIRAKTGRTPVNYYLYGHFHRAMELPHSLGRVIVNGGFPGVDEYGMTENFSAVPPVQKFFFMHRKFGISASYDLNLAFAKTDGVPYELPKEFPLV